ncbi:TPA: hypothetical protein NNT44_004660 [Salmonella enterica]|nr:hypothetical protein [Salmonella enterica]HCH9337340.1 hypothetical protein [Salmonella enterica]HCH9607979.1 hypothetical protein [Salmonella enterica]HDI5000273.1 hypothetical protein [Salmonella enterica]HDI5005094.1 hypothetical protein [Salmonella enterica]
MNASNKIEIQLPFSGFYYSIHDSYIDNHIEYELDYLQSELGYTDEQLDVIKDRFYDMDYAPIRKAICEHYIKAYNAVFYDEYNIHLDLEYNRIVSPSFYNYETDKLYALIDESVFNEVTALINGEEFKALLKDKFKPQSGFTPFQSTLDAIENGDNVLFSAELLEQLLPEEKVINDYQYTDNISEVIRNSCNVDYEL